MYLEAATLCCLIHFDIMQSSLRVQAFGSATSAAAQRRCVVRASAPASRSVQAVTCSLTSAAAGTFAPRAASQLATRPARSFGVTRSARSVSVRAEISYVMVKPDGVQRGLVGEIISRFERKGFKLRALKLYQTPKEVAEEHYKDLASKPFYGALVQYILSGPVCCMVRTMLTVTRHVVALYLHPMPSLARQ